MLSFLRSNVIDTAAGDALRSHQDHGHQFIVISHIVKCQFDCVSTDQLVLELLC